jgi:uncharacterized membrane protein HdeD (DUF308 family)
MPVVCGILVTMIVLAMVFAGALFTVGLLGILLGIAGCLLGLHIRMCRIADNEKWGKPCIDEDTPRAIAIMVCGVILVILGCLLVF